MSASCLILDMTTPPSNGKMIEYGIALAQGLDIIVIRNRPDEYTQGVFWSLADQRLNGWDMDALTACLDQMGVQRFERHVSN